MARMVKNRPPMQVTGLRCLGRGASLGEGLTTHSSILAWKIPRTEEPGGLQSVRSQEPDMTEQLTHTKKVKQVSLQRHFLGLLVC